MGMRPVSSRFVPENGGFLGISAGLYTVYEKFAGKLRDDCEMTARRMGTGNDP